MPTSFNEEYNRFFGDTSQAAMQSASKVNTDFRNGEIDKRTYLMANLNSQVSMTVDSMTKYATMVNDLEEKKAAGELSDEDLFKLSQLQAFSDLGNVSIAFDPQSYQASLIKIGEGMKGGYDIMSINQYFNGINMKFQGKYDTAGAIKSTLSNLAGTRDITTAAGRQEVGKFIKTTEGQEALQNSAEAMLSQPTALRGFAMANTIKDDVGTVNFEYASVPMEYYEVGGILIAQRSGQRIDKDTLGILLANTKGNINFEVLAGALEGIPDKPSATELKRQYDEEKAKKNALKMDFAKNYLKDNLFTVDGAFVNPADESGVYTESEIETLITPLGLNMQKEEDNFIVYSDNIAVLNLGKEVTKERMELLKQALIAGDEDLIYSLFRRSNPDYTYESDVIVKDEEEEELIDYPLD